MKNLFVTLSVLALCFVSCKKEVKVETTTTKTDSTVVTRPKADTVTKAPMDSVAEQKAWMDYATPGEGQKLLADDTGTWNEDLTFWMSEGGKPMKYTSTGTSKMVLGGRYQEMVHKGKIMGMDFEGHGTLAYDNTTKEYISTWVDNMGTGITVCKGTYDPATKAITLKGDMVNPTLGKAAPFKQVYTIVDANTRKVESYDTKNGKEYKSMEIIMKRK